MPLTENAVGKVAVLASTAMLVVLAVLSPWLQTSEAQTETTFGPNAEFAIPERNGVICFAVNGTYEQAALQDGSWRFVNLSLNGTYGYQKLNLTASAENSKVTILWYRAFNVTFSGISLRYNVTGQGKQTFTFGELPEVGEWSIALNRDFMGVNDGWTVEGHTVTVTEATENVSITYYSLPDLFGNASDSNLPFYQRHSVAIATAIALTVTLAVAAAIWRVNRKRSTKELT